MKKKILFIVFIFSSSFLSLIASDIKEKLDIKVHSISMFNSPIIEKGDSFLIGELGFNALLDQYSNDEFMSCLKKKVEAGDVNATILLGVIAYQVMPPLERATTYDFILKKSLKDSDAIPSKERQMLRLIKYLSFIYLHPDNSTKTEFNGFPDDHSVIRVEEIIAEAKNGTFETIKKINKSPAGTDDDLKLYLAILLRPGLGIIDNKKMGMSIADADVFGVIINNLLRKNYFIGRCCLDIYNFYSSSFVPDYISKIKSLKYENIGLIYRCLSKIAVDNNNYNDAAYYYYITIRQEYKPILDFLRASQLLTYLDKSKEFSEAIIFQNYIETAFKLSPQEIKTLQELPSKELIEYEKNLSSSDAIALKAKGEKMGKNRIYQNDKFEKLFLDSARERLSHYKKSISNSIKKADQIDFSKKTIEELNELSKKGDSYAQCELGHRYANGIGVSQDLQLSFEWFKKSADQNNPQALLCIGGFYCNGLNEIKKDLSTGIEYYKKASEKGNAEASLHIAVLYSNKEIGIKEDLLEFFKWIFKAAEQNDGIAQDALSKWYKEGVFIPMDLEKAKIWKKRAEKNMRLKGLIK